MNDSGKWENAFLLKAGRFVILTDFLYRNRELEIDGIILY